MTPPALREWLEALPGLKRSGDQWQGPCPLCGGTDRFRVTKDGGAFCRQCLPNGGNPERLVELENAVFGDGRRREAQTTTIHRYPIVDADGTTLLTICRREGPDGKKCGTPPIWREPTGVKAPAAGYPLFRLPSILANADKPLLVVEGEKTAEAAQHLLGDRYEATTAIGGAGKAAQTDWTPAKGRDVVCWPDTGTIDDKGRDKGREAREHMEAVARLCRKAGAASTRIVDVSDLPKDPPWDLADRIPDGCDIEAKVSSAHPVPIRADEGLRQFGGLPFMSVGELLTASDEGVAWLVDQMLPAGGFSMLVAKPKAGKSTLARTLALMTARGEPWLGRQVQRGPVLYIALEEQRAVVAEHFRAMGVHVDDGLEVYVGPPPANAMDALAAAFEAQPRPALVIVDPLFRLVAIDDGNDYAKVTAALAPLVDMARTTGAHVLTVHHARKMGGDDGDETLGSTGLLGAVDCNLSLKRSPGGERYLKTLQRVGSDMPETLLTMDPETMVISAGETKAAKTQADLETLIVDHLRDTRHSHTVPDLAKAINRRETAVRSTLRTMTDQGRVVRSGEGKSGDPHRFEIVDDV